MVTLATLRRRSRLVATAGAMALLTLVATACGGGGDSQGAPVSGAAPAAGGILRIGITESNLPPSSLNPFVGVNTYDSIAYLMTYPTILQLDGEGNTEGSWAESWEVSEDGRTYTFSLRPGEWSDGTPLTAEDAVFTAEMVMRYADGPTGGQAVYLEDVEAVEAPDPQTLVIRYSKPKPEDIIGNSLNVLWILPKHVWQEHAGNGGKDLKEFAPQDELPAVSGGPFAITEFEPKGTTIFEPNPGFYGEKPRVDAVGLQVFQNPEGITRAMQSGNLDLAPSATEVATSIEGDPGLDVVKGPSQTTYAVDINSNPEKREDPELDDARVREAISLAIDRERIVEVELNGLGEPARSVLNPTSEQWIPDSLDADPYDPARANEILDELGYERGEDGIRVTGDGRRMEYDFTLWESTRLNEIVVQNLEEIGIRFKTELIQGPGWNTAIMAPDGKYLESDFSVTAWGFLYDPNDALAIHSCGAWGGNNLHGYCNEAYDALLREQRVELDKGRRKEIVAEMQMMLLREDRVVLPLVYPANVSVVADGWAGVDPGLWGYQMWTDVHRVEE